MFTTQDTFRLINAARNTAAQWDDGFIGDAIKEITVTNECNPETPERDRILELLVAMPNYMVGKAPYATGGGGFVIEDNEFVQQGNNEFKLYAKMPCQRLPGVEAYGLEVLGAGTAQAVANEDSYISTESKGLVKILLDAPYSSPQREPGLGAFLEGILKLININTSDVYQILTHFNPFNIESNIGLHHQYALELVFAGHIGERLETYIDIPGDVPIDRERIGYSGWSFGAMASMRAAMIDDGVDSLRLMDMSRMSYLSVNHIFAENYFIPESLLNAVSDYVGVTMPLSDADPALHLLQTVMEPVDLINFVSELDDISILVGMDRYEHPVHGGESGYQLLKAFDESASFDLRFPFDPEWEDFFGKDIAESIEDTLGRSYDQQGNYSHDIVTDGPVRIVIPKFYPTEANCFAYEILQWEAMTLDYQTDGTCYH